MRPPPEEASDRQAFEALVGAYLDRMFSVALGITGSREDAEDALQDALVSAYRNWTEFRGESSGATWLYRIMVNAALQRVRRRHPEDYLTATGYAQESVTDWSEDLVRRVEANELRDVLERGILLLPEELRAALVLRDVEGLSTAEAAVVLDLSEAALKSRLHRARVLLRQYLSEYLESR